MGERLPISIVLITSGKNPREPLWNSQLLLSGRVSQVLRVSPDEVLFSEKSYLPDRVLELSRTSGLQVFHLQCPWGDRNLARNLGHRAATEEFVYHLDEDVEPPTWEDMNSALAEFQAADVHWVAGPYLNAPLLSLPAKIYNFLSSLWVRLGEKDHALFLGGHVLCRRSSFEWPTDHLTGGEEMIIAKELTRKGLRGIYRKSFGARHHNNHDWRLLGQRLWQHESAKKSDETSKLRKFLRLLKAEL